MPPVAATAALVLVTCGGHTSGVAAWAGPVAPTRLMPAAISAAAVNLSAGPVAWWRQGFWETQGGAGGRLNGCVSAASRTAADPLVRIG